MSQYNVQGKRGRRGETDSGNHLRMCSSRIERSRGRGHGGWRRSAAAGGSGLRSKAGYARWQMPQGQGLRSKAGSTLKGGLRLEGGLCSKAGYARWQSYARRRVTGGLRSKAGYARRRVTLGGRMPHDGRGRLDGRVTLGGMITLGGWVVLGGTIGFNRKFVAVRDREVEAGAGV
ncbi:hypothetical protein DFH06DRAFT_558431 [Mycena polygramma]|nr:hypothetical protein DFH06DRAFT_558431 [Mycena polygramma]